MAEGQVKTRLQDVRNFTVQIRHGETDEIVGTGIAISLDGDVVTCRHVFEDAAGKAGDLEHAEVNIYYPRSTSRSKSRRAKLAAYFSDSDDDIVLLKAIGTSALAPEQIAIVSDAWRSEGNNFRSYGYRSLSQFDAGWADGNIMGSVESPQGVRLQLEPVQLDSKHVNHGMSGAAVLDTRRNLVVGIISMTYFSDKYGKDRDTGWAVNTHILTFDPLKMPIYDGEFLEMKAPAKPSEEILVEAGKSVGQNLKLTEYAAPLPPEEWVGRTELLRYLNQDWVAPNIKVAGLIGFGGEGKSSLAARWIAELLQKSGQQPPDGLFWWSFYDRRSVDEFFEAALRYLSGGDDDLLQRCKSPNARAHLIAGMLYSGRYLFVLDGLEVLQQQEGDNYGAFNSEDLRQFLEYFSATEHASFCLITSRAPVSDLMDSTSYRHHDVARLTANEGCALLKNIGVTGAEAELKKAVELWDGHALTLSLIGAYLAKAHNGDIAHLGDIEPPTAAEPRYDRVHRILRRYDEHLNADERAFLQVFSAFRIPVTEAALEDVFRKKTKNSALNAPVAELDETGFKTLLDHLQRYRILRYDPLEKYYTTHPLIRAHYSAVLARADVEKRSDLHWHIADFYLASGGELSTYPSLEDLAPYIEAVHHGCVSGRYDDAGHIYWKRILQDERKVLTYQLGAYETNLNVIRDFFPDHDTSKKPQLNDPVGNIWLVNEFGYGLMSLGRLNEVAPFYESTIKQSLDHPEYWRETPIAYCNLAGLSVYLGHLQSCVQAAKAAFNLAQKAKNWNSEKNALCYEAWALHLLGALPEASTIFKQAEAKERELDPGATYLYALRGSRYTEHLRRLGKRDEARRVIEANLEVCHANHWADDTSRCCRAIGNLYLDAEDFEKASQYYTMALKIAQRITRQDVLIEALLAQGSLQAKLPPNHVRSSGRFGLNSLNEALGYALKGGYRIHEADIRVALAWTHQALGNSGAARAEAQQALNMSEEMGYYWGKVDATAFLEKNGD